VRRLLIANAALVVLLVGHIADHSLRQPAGAQLSLSASFPGLLGTLLAVISLALVARDAKHAPQFAGFIGLATALGFVAIHLLPHWSMFSDPYRSRYLDAGSWIEMLAALSCGLLVAIEAKNASRSDARRATRRSLTTSTPG
jgi:hypothetical protein